MTRRFLLGGVLIAVSSVACSNDQTQDTRSTMTQREKDSTLANSQIPGAKAVKKAFTTADSATARQNRIDSAQNNP
ncbi:MAG TPA: hypothetical protein VIH53_06255 [Gemmatimonadaceae bacterium]